MRQRTLIQCLAVIAVLALAWVLWPTGQPRSVEPANRPSAPTQLTESPRSIPPMASAPQPAEPVLIRPLATEPRPAAPPPQVVRVSPGQVLAKVNHMPVQLEHLMPVRAAETEKELTPEQYRSRLQRAIEMELTFQAARLQGVELTEAQQQRLDQIAKGHQADEKHYQDQGLSWSTVDAAQVEFEQRLLAAQMLEQNLVARQAAVSPSPDPAVQARYEQARRELFDQLQASANIAVAVPAP